MRELKQNLILLLKKENTEIELLLFKEDYKEVQNPVEYFKFNIEKIKKYIKKILDKFTARIEKYEFGEYDELNAQDKASIFDLTDELLSVDKYTLNIEKYSKSEHNIDIHPESFGGYVFKITSNEKSIYLFKIRPPYEDLAIKNAFFCDLEANAILKKDDHKLYKIFDDIDFIVLNDKLILFNHTIENKLGIGESFAKIRENTYLKIEELKMVSDIVIKDLEVMSDMNRLRKNTNMKFRAMKKITSETYDIYTNDFPRFKKDSEIYHIKYDENNKIIIRSKEDAANFIDYLADKKIFNTLKQKVGTASNVTLNG